MGTAQAHAGFHRARHGHRLPGRKHHPRAVLRPRPGRRHAGRDPRQPGGDRRLSRHGGARRMTDLRGAGGWSAFYGASQILFDVDLALQQERTLALLGRNGAGKSTTMKTLAGIVPAKGGRVFFAGRDITSAPPHARAKLGLAYVPEDRQVFPEHSVEDNLLIPAKDGPSGRRAWTLPRVWDTFPLL